MAAAPPTRSATYTVAVRAENAVAVVVSAENTVRQWCMWEAVAVIYGRLAVICMAVYGSDQADRLMSCSVWQCVAVSLCGSGTGSVSVWQCIAVSLYSNVSVWQWHW